MNLIIKYLKTISYIFMCVILFTFFIDIFYYFNFISTGLYKILKIMILLVSIFINCIFLGKDSNKNGYLEGMKLSFILVIILFILNIIFREEIKIKILLYYFIIFLTSSFGSILGINIKEKELN